MRLAASKEGAKRSFRLIWEIASLIYIMRASLDPPKLSHDCSKKSMSPNSRVSDLIAFLYFIAMADTGLLFFHPCNSVLILLILCGCFFFFYTLTDEGGEIGCSPSVKVRGGGTGRYHHTLAGG